MVNYIKLALQKTPTKENKKGESLKYKREIPQ